jgi:hypothetical protein
MRLYISRGWLALEDFLFFLLYLFSCIATNNTTFERLLRLLFLSLSLNTHFKFSYATSISPAPDLVRYTRTSPQ